MTLIAETVSGAVEGREKEEVLLFAGIPYAAPAVGELRFRAAEAAVAWSGVDFFLGEGPVPQQVADTMHTAWTAFIRDGDPGWDVYTPETRLTMRFDDSSGVVADPHAISRQAWEGLR